MNFSGVWQKIHRHHGLMMVLCFIPLLIGIVSTYYFGFTRSYAVWLLLLLCPLMHYLMMKEMHEGHSDTETARAEQYPAQKHHEQRKGSCH